MKISLISPYPDITSFGVRILSSVLKEHGCQTQLIFLPDPYGDEIIHGVSRYKESIMEEVAELCRDSQLIGISVMTNFFDGAVQVTKSLQSKLSAPVIWGGVHPTIRPEESIRIADIICVGDGEETLLELADSLAKGRDYSTIKNLWCRTNNNISRNPVRLLQRELDSYPHPDYSLDDHHLMLNDTVQPMSSSLLESALKCGSVSSYLHKIGYQTMTGRGCPHKCTYCINDSIKKIYSGQSYLRWRSTAHVMDELVGVKKQMPFVNFIWISDDAFFARPTEVIKEFCEEYKRKIGLPFSCLASPLTVSAEKMRLLTDAGLVYMQMGIQSGSPRIQELFNRKSQSNAVILKAATIINSFRDKMYPPSYDFILDVPYETTDDKIDSLKLIAQLPKPFKLQPFSLVLYPGTQLHKMAVDDGFISNEHRDIYAKTYTMNKLNYLNILILLSKTGRMPGGVLKILLSTPVVKILNSSIAEPFLKYFYLGLKRGYHTLNALGK